MKNILIEFYMLLYLLKEFF